MVGHHAGVLFAPLGEVGPTRWADWIDLAVPLLVLGFAAATLAAARASRTAWVVFGPGAVLYTQGHGIHLAANSVANSDPGEAAHLWDEVVSHHLWYGGLAVVVAALALELAPRLRRATPWSLALAALWGLTATTTGIEGGTAVLALATGVAFVAWGWRERRRGGGELLAGYGLSVVLLVGWGLYWRGFPQFSELGWI